jgi:hypothetical protein
MVNIVITRHPLGHSCLSLQPIHVPVNLCRLHKDPYQQKHLRSLGTSVYEEVIMDKEFGLVGILLLVDVDLV